jgi:hypothetical protein
MAARARRTPPGTSASPNVFLASAKIPTMIVPMSRQMAVEAIGWSPPNAAKILGEAPPPGHFRVAVSNCISALARQAGVRLTMKTLRASFGCRYAGKVPAQVLQRLMRHASIKTTMDFYANVDDAVMQAVLGAGRNSSRNTPESSAARVGGTDAPSAAEQGGSS